MAQDAKIGSECKQNAHFWGHSSHHRIPKQKFGGPKRRKLQWFLDLPRIRKRAQLKLNCLQKDIPFAPTFGGNSLELTRPQDGGE